MNEFVHSNWFIVLFVCVVGTAAYLASDVPGPLLGPAEPELSGTQFYPSIKLEAVQTVQMHVGNACPATPQKQDWSATAAGLREAYRQDPSCPIKVVVAKRYSRMPQ